MIGSKELYDDLMAKCEMPEALYKKLSEEHEEIVFRGYTSEGLRNEYKKNPEWLETTKTIKEAIEYRNEIESDIRVDKFFKED